MSDEQKRFKADNRKDAAQQAAGGEAQRAAAAAARALFERQYKERWGDTPTLTGGEAQNLPDFRAEDFVSRRVALPVICNGKIAG